MWADNETTSDLLGFKVHSDLIRSVVLDAELLPIVVGVFGDRQKNFAADRRKLSRQKNESSLLSDIFRQTVFDNFLSGIIFPLHANRKRDNVPCSVAAFLHKFRSLKSKKINNFVRLNHSAKFLKTQNLLLQYFVNLV